MKKDAFRKAIDTLKLYRRAELLDDSGRAIINELYVDPLPNNHILQTILRNNTTYLIGRKGTGKSTIFQRAQEELNKDGSVTWAYIDIKTLFESSVTEIKGRIPNNHINSLSEDEIEKINIFRNFVIELIKEIKKQITTRISSSIWGKIKESMTGDVNELFEKLDEFVEELQSPHFLDVTGVISATEETGNIEKEAKKIGGNLEVNQSALPSVKLSAYSELNTENERLRSQNHSQIFIRVFRIHDLISRLIEILSTLSVRHLYIFIDDFSELQRDDMEQVVETILAPFNNWSNEFIKLKIAFYPGRIYSGDIDSSKVDEVYLDLYNAYGQHDVSLMEEKAKEFTQRLVTTRVRHFCKESIDEYFDTTAKDIWQTLYYSCLGNPRILGYILYFCYESNIIYDKKINIKAIQDSSRRYYSEKISHFFRLQKFQYETYEERSSLYSLKELFEEIVKKSKELRTYKGSKLFQELNGRPPTSHFYVINDYEKILSTLELNFFITKYYEMKDRDGNDVSIYSLNYGLCQQESISFGRPIDKREYRLYYVERIFDFNPLILAYLKINQEITCENCGAKHDPEDLKTIQKYDMLCPKCKKGKCKIDNISRKYESLINSINLESILPGTDLGILKTIHDERKAMYAKELAGELDCSYQLIGKRGKILEERELLKRDEDPSHRRVFTITNLAKKRYFENTPEDSLDFDILESS